LDLIKIDGPATRRQHASAWQKWLAASMLAVSFLLLAAPVASAETRTLKLYYTHTRERADITFKKNGRYIQSGLDQLNKFLRDWRRNEPTKMDPKLFDIVWEAYQAARGRDYIHVVSAYRSPATNSMLRKRSSGVAEKSQHTLGKAMDFYIPGVKLSTLRAVALRLQGGGVGYYPRSGSPFVHLDVGSVRHWPRMNRNELMALFPDGKTIHLPTDGKPLPGYQQALAAYKSRKASGSAVQVASAQRSGGFLSRLFGGGADEEEDSREVAMIAAAPEAAVGRGTVPSSRAKPVRQAPNVAPPAVATPAAEPAVDPQTPETIIAALPERTIPTPLFAPRPQVDVGAQIAAAKAEASADSAAADAAQPAIEPVEVALSIPVPTDRPIYRPLVQPEPEKRSVSAEVEDVAVATVADKRRPDTGSLAIADLLATGRPSEAETLATAAPMPALRPDWQQQATAYAPLSETKKDTSTSLLPHMASSALGPGKARRVAAASPRLALLERESGIDPATILGTGVRTTAKAAKPGAGDLKPDAKPIVMPVREQIARWALQSGHVTRLRSATTPALAHDTLRSAPTAVYTIGFEQGEGKDPYRFAGKAVSFLPVAKFATN
jgi:uncharacterized protein YcbK (DUF882 family)